jgi:hypothetical protein
VSARANAAATGIAGASQRSQAGDGIGGSAVSGATRASDRFYGAATRASKQYARPPS